MKAPSTRPAIERLLRVHAEIARGNYPNANKLARALEVSVKTVQRDLVFLRDRLRLPLAYDPQRWGFYYRPERRQLPFAF